jgi:aminopeptidase YwaD
MVYINPPFCLMRHSVTSLLRPVSKISDSPFVRKFVRLLPMFLWLIPVTGNSQTLIQANQVVQDLCSDQMAGRGYQENGHGKAARYIADRFSELGLEPWQPRIVEGRKDWFQSFPFQVNLVETTFLNINGKTLTPGRDYIVHGLSGSTKGSFRAAQLDYGMGEDWEAGKAKGKAAIVKLGFPPHYAQDEKNRQLFLNQTRLAFKLEMAQQYNPSLLMIQKDKLTAGFSTQALPYALVEVQNSSLPKRVKKVEVHIKTSLQKVNSTNVMGSIQGGRFPDSLIIVSAHYDHLGKQGEAIFRGANDNASGVAFLLGLAGYLNQLESPPDYTIVFIAFGAEEVGLMGSTHWVQTADTSVLNRIKFMLNFDLMGNGDEGICLVAGEEYPELAARIKKKLPSEYPVEIRPNAPNSDHYPFVKAGVPAIFTYTKGGPPWYHDIMDTPEAVRFPSWQVLLHAFSGLITENK